MPRKKDFCPKCGLPKKIEATTCRRCFIESWICPEALCKKRSESAKNRWNNPSFKARLSGEGLLQETRKKHSEAMRGLWENPEYKRKMSEVSKENWKDEGYRKHQIKRLRAYRHSEDSRKKIGDRHRGKTISEKARIKNSLSNKGHHRSPNTEFTSELLKKRYCDPVYVQKMAKAWNIKPNKPETFMLNLLNKLYPNEWKYTGDFSFIINGKCPDFINCNGQKKIIELWGDYWHKGQDSQDRIDAFKPFGYETLVIWERELKHMDSVIKNIHDFMGA